MISLMAGTAAARQ